MAFQKVPKICSQHIAQSVKTRPIDGFNYIKDIFKFQVAMFYYFNINSAAYGVISYAAFFISVFKKENAAPGQMPERSKY